MIWWLENPGRARSERQSVAELAERVSWLKNLRWYLSDGAALAVDFCRHVLQPKGPRAAVKQSRP